MPCPVAVLSPVSDSWRAPPPPGAGPNACGAATPCNLDTATCATGAGAGLGYNYYCNFTSPAGGIPAGSGQLCFDSYDHCMNAPNACNPSSTFNGTFNAAMNCTVRTDICATGQAAGSGNAIVCPADIPGAALTTVNSTVWSLLPSVGGNLTGAMPTALPHGGGPYCFDGLQNCVNALNACNSSVPCHMDQATCATGLAEWGTNYYVCPLDVPTGAVPNGAGEYCYDTDIHCLGGPNGCGLNVPCTYDTATCSTGQAAGALSANWFCSAVVPPGATHNGAGERCYDTIANCSSGPNRCDASSCYQNNATCSSGVSAGQGTVVFCDQTQPPGAIPNGAGMLCYNESSWCLLGPNACGVSPVPGAVVVGGTTRSDGTQVGGAAFNGSAVLLGTLMGDGSVSNSSHAVVGCVTSMLYTDTNFSVGLVTACAVNGSVVNSTIFGESLGTAVGSPVYSGGNMLGVVDPGGSGYLYSVVPATAPGGYIAPVGSIVGSVVMNVTNGTGVVQSLSYGIVACQIDYVTCSSGQAGPTSNNWFCETDYPMGSMANGAGQLCYLTAEKCVQGA